MNKLFKGIGTTAASAIIAASLTFSSFAAGPGQMQGQNGPQQGPPQMQSESSSDNNNSQSMELPPEMPGSSNSSDSSQPPALPENVTSSDSSQPPALPDGELPELTDGELPELPENATSSDSSQPPALPDGELPELTDGELPKLPENATSSDSSQPPALPDGELPELTDGELPEKPDGAPEDGNMGMVPPSESIEQIQSAIDSVEDEDLQNSLQELYDNLESALAAEKEALDSEDVDEEALEELKAAVNEAMESLKSALEDAGIEYDLEVSLPEDNGERPDFSENISSGNEEIEAPASFELPTIDESSSSTSSNENIFSKIGNTLKDKLSQIGNFFQNLT